MLSKIWAKITQPFRVRKAQHRLNDYVESLPPEKQILAKSLYREIEAAPSPAAKVAVIRKKVDNLQGHTAQVQSRVEAIRRQIGSTPAPLDNHAIVMAMPIQRESYGYNSDTYSRCEPSATDSSSSSSSDSSSSSSCD